ncbi:MAG: hypothetical protein WBP85_02800 [Terracidiphilus sp.]
MSAKVFCRIGVKYSAILAEREEPFVHALSLRGCDSCGMGDQEVLIWKLARQFGRLATSVVLHTSLNFDLRRRKKSQEEQQTKQPFTVAPCDNP